MWEPQHFADLGIDTNPSLLKRIFNKIKQIKFFIPRFFGYINIY